MGIDVLDRFGGRGRSSGRLHASRAGARLNRSFGVLADARRAFRVQAVDGTVDLVVRERSSGDAKEACKRSLASVLGREVSYGDLRVSRCGRWDDLPILEVGKPWDYERVAEWCRARRDGEPA